MDASVDIAAINQMSETLFKDLLQICLQFLQRQYRQDPAANGWLRQTMEAYASKHSINVAQLKPPCKALLTLAENVQDRRESVPELSSSLSSLGLDAPKVETLLQMLQAEKEPSGTAHPNQLVDAQWQFGVTVASGGQEEAAKRAFVQLRLTVRRPDGSLGDVHCEMSAPQFFSFCHEMEQAKMAMHSLRA